MYHPRLTAKVHVLAGLALCTLACSDGTGKKNSGLEALDVTRLVPSELVPGTQWTLSGRSFVDPRWGTSTLVVHGTVTRNGDTLPLDVSFPVTFRDLETATIEVTDQVFAALGGDGAKFSGTVSLEVASAVDGLLHHTRDLPVTFSVHDQLTPSISKLETSQVIYVNDDILMEGDGFLLQENEGKTVAHVAGCFQEDGATECTPIGDQVVATTITEPFSRKRVAFGFKPEIVGIKPGQFNGTVWLENISHKGNSAGSDPVAVSFTVVETAIRTVTPTAVSFGQYIDVFGGGFLNGSGQSTVLHVVGTFQASDGEQEVVDTYVVPTISQGRLARYSLTQDDAFGAILKPRSRQGKFSGTITPEVSYGDLVSSGEPAAFNFTVLPVKQVVYVKFISQYATSLHAFGARAIDDAVRTLIFEVLARDFRTINMEFRAEEPTDFFLYSEVEIGGPDPNGQGYLGYDNTPGKDGGNERLHDRIGGVNAQTQQDGYPGYGGVFIESLFIFSEHPGEFADGAGADPLFDQIFDSFRPDVGGEPISAADLQGVDLHPTSGKNCPGKTRKEAARCAIWVLGTLIGTTLSHELGHSLGLANPDSDEPHLFGDLPNRLMESGGGRSFRERTELGEGPGKFCSDEYVYLRTILPTDEDEDMSMRPACD